MMHRPSVKKLTDSNSVYRMMSKQTRARQAELAKPAPCATIIIHYSYAENQFG